MQQGYENRICTSLPSSLRIAWKGVLKPRHFLGVRLAKPAAEPVKHNRQIDEAAGQCPTKKSRISSSPSSSVAAPCTMPALSKSDCFAGRRHHSDSDRSNCQRFRTPINPAPVQKRPDDPRHFVGQRDSGHLEGPPGEKRCQPSVQSLITTHR